ncbi:major capsid protein [Enterobacter hormaechei]
MLIRNMLLKYYAPESGGEGSGGGGIEITPEIQKLIDERVTSEVTGLKSKNSELLGTIKQQKENLSRFDGIDPDAVRGILQRFSDDEEAKLIAAGKIDEVLDKRTERMRADVDKQIKAANERAEKAEAFSNKFRDRVLGDAIRAAASKAGALPEASDDLILRAKGTFQLNDEGEAVSVKAPWKYGPYETTEEAFKRRGRSVDEFSEVIGVDVADATLEGYVKYGLKALTAAIGANADMVVTADIETDGKKTLTRGLRKYGDKFNRVVLFVMHSATYFDIVDEAIANKIYEEAGVVVYGGQPGTLGKPVLVTDTMDADAILGLVAGAVTVTESQAPGFRSYDINDQENLAIGYRAEGVVNVDLLGYSWDTAKGDNPDLTAIGTAGNWKKHFTSNKSTAGVLIKLGSAAGE